MLKCVGGSWTCRDFFFFYGDFIMVAESSESFVSLHNWLLSGVSLSSFSWCCKLSQSHILKEVFSMFTFRDKVLKERHQNCLGIYKFFYSQQSKCYYVI